MLRTRTISTTSTSIRRNTSNNVVYGTKSGSFTVYGDYPDWNYIDPVDIIEGRYINEMDIINYRKVVVISNLAKNTLFANDEEPLNKFIRVNGVYYKVVGIFKSKNQADKRKEKKRTPSIYHNATNI